MQKASNAGLDLVEVSPQVDPPVCKILDFGKFKYTLKMFNEDAAEKKLVRLRKNKKKLQLKKLR